MYTNNNYNNNTQQNAEILARDFYFNNTNINFFEIAKAGFYNKDFSTFMYQIGLYKEELRNQGIKINNAQDVINILKIWCGSTNDNVLEKDIPNLTIKFNSGVQHQRLKNNFNFNGTEINFYKITMESFSKKQNFISFMYQIGFYKEELEKQDIEINVQDAINFLKSFGGANEIDKSFENELERCFFDGIQTQLKQKLQQQLKQKYNIDIFEDFYYDNKRTIKIRYDYVTKPDKKDNIKNDFDEIFKEIEKIFKNDIVESEFEKDKLVIELMAKYNIYIYRLSYDRELNVKQLENISCQLTNPEQIEAVNNNFDEISNSIKTTFGEEIHDKFIEQITEIREKTEFKEKFELESKIVGAVRLKYGKKTTVEDYFLNPKYGINIENKVNYYYNNNYFYNQYIKNRINRENLCLFEKYEKTFNYYDTLKDEMESYELDEEGKIINIKFNKYDFNSKDLEELCKKINTNKPSKQQDITIKELEIHLNKDKESYIANLKEQGIIIEEKEFGFKIKFINFSNYIKHYFDDLNEKLGINKKELEKQFNEQQKIYNKIIEKVYITIDTKGDIIIDNFKVYNLKDTELVELYKNIKNLNIKINQKELSYEATDVLNSMLIQKNNYIANLKKEGIIIEEKEEKGKFKIKFTNFNNKIKNNFDNLSKKLGINKEELEKQFNEQEAIYNKITQIVDITIDINKNIKINGVKNYTLDEAKLQNLYTEINKLNKIYDNTEIKKEDLETELKEQKNKYIANLKEQGIIVEEINNTQQYSERDDIQDLYHNNYAYNYYSKIDKKDIEHTFNIIKAFYKRQDEICEGEEKNIHNELKQTSEIQSIGELQAPKLNPKDNIYFSTDHHGDLSAFMFSLLESGVAKFKEGGPSTIYFDMNTNKVIENEEEIKKYIEENGTNGLVPIPNLEINPEFDGKFICGGDLIDRGKETDNCFCLMYHLLNQSGAENKIEYIVGNHEEMTLKNGNGYYNGNNQELLRKSLINLIEHSKLKFASPSGQTIFSHTVFNKEQILIALDVMINDEKRDKYFNDGNYDDENKIKIDFNEETKQYAKILKEKIEKNEELKEEDIELLTIVLNDLFVKKVESLEKIGYQQEDDIFMINGGIYAEGLLWQRDISEKDKINGLYQVVGHEAQISTKMPKLENKIIRADACQSSGYNNNYSNAVLLHFENDKCIVEQKNIGKFLIKQKAKEDYIKPKNQKNNTFVIKFENFTVETEQNLNKKKDELQRFFGFDVTNEFNKQKQAKKDELKNNYGYCIGSYYNDFNKYDLSKEQLTNLSQELKNVFGIDKSIEDLEKQMQEEFKNKLKEFRIEIEKDAFGLITDVKFKYFDLKEENIQELQNLTTSFERFGYISMYEEELIDKYKLEKLEFDKNCQELKEKYGITIKQEIYYNNTEANPTLGYKDIKEEDISKANELLKKVGFNDDKWIKYSQERRRNFLSEHQTSVRLFNCLDKIQFLIKNDRVIDGGTKTIKEFLTDKNFEKIQLIERIEVLLLANHRVKNDIVFFLYSLLHDEMLGPKIQEEIEKGTKIKISARHNKAKDIIEYTEQPLKDFIEQYTGEKIEREQQLYTNEELEKQKEEIERKRQDGLKIQREKFEEELTDKYKISFTINEKDEIDLKSLKFNNFDITEVQLNEIERKLNKFGALDSEKVLESKLNEFKKQQIEYELEEKYGIEIDIKDNNKICILSFNKHDFKRKEFENIEKLLKKYINILKKEDYEKYKNITNVNISEIESEYNANLLNEALDDMGQILRPRTNKVISNQF